MTGYFTFNKHRARSSWIHLFCVLLIFLASGCGSDNSAPGTSDNIDSASNSNSNNTGSASFAIQWHTASAVQASAVVRQAIENCETAGVASITCIVYDGSHNPIASGGPWDCSDHQGTVEQIPAGANRILAVLGWSDPGGGGDVVYQGQTAGITITPGQITDVGTIDARPFVPDAPEHTAVYGNRIELAWNDLGIYGYRIYRDGAAVGDSTSAAFNDTGLSPVTTYCYSISGLDSFGNESAQSDPTCAETANEGSNVYYRDADNDTYGNPDDSTQAAVAPDGYVENNTDCNDNNANINPGADEICGDTIDQDCNGSDLSCDDVDNDGDGFTESQGDCDDSNADVNPDAAEVCNGIDDNCAGGIDEGLSTDVDGDRHYTAGSCLTPHDDCDDTNPDRFPGNDEICGDGIDQDCNGSDLSCDDVDNDGDGFSESQGDCDDSNADVNPDATEVCNGVDDNCTGGIDEGLSTDVDGDHHYTVDSCLTPHDDCDDGDPARFPGNNEICDNRDNDCNDYVDDGLTRTTTCGVGACAGNTGIEICTAGVWGGDTCDPDYGASSEECDNVDNDCNGSVDENLTRTTTCGVGACAGNTGTETCTAGNWGGDTCDPDYGASPEECDNVDNDCDGSVDENLTRTTTCGVGACAGNTGTETCTAGNWGDDTCDPDYGASDEICTDDIDNNCDGVTNENCPIEVDIDYDFDYVAQGFPMGLAVGQTLAAGQLRTYPPYETLTEPSYYSLYGEFYTPYYGYLLLGDSQDMVFSFVIVHISGSDEPYEMFFDRNNNENLTDDGGPISNQADSSVLFGAQVSLNVNVATSAHGMISRQYNLWMWLNTSQQVRFYARCHYRGELNIGGDTFTAVAFEVYNHDVLYRESGLYIDINRNNQLTDAENFMDGDTVTVNNIGYELHLNYP